MTLDGLSVKYTDPTVVVPSSARQISFQVGDTPAVSNPKIMMERIRYKMEGVDADWLQRDGTMSFDLYFYNRSGDKIGQKIYEAIGNSSGWNESIETSTFTHRHETLMVPPSADSLSVVITSAGPEDSVGVYVVEDVFITRRRQEGDLPETVLNSSPLPQTGHDPLKWFVEGNRPSMAKMLNLHGPESPTQALCIIDDSMISHAEWDSSKAKVIPNEHLTVEWNEMYNSARGAESYFQYGPLSAGHYRFKVQEVDVFGHPLKEENSMDIWIPIPYWRNPWFLAFCASAAAILSAFGGRYYVQTNIRRHLERTRWVEQERLRIARDLHDDLGTRLAHLSLMSAHAEKETSTPDARASFQEFSGMARELASSLSEVVWMVNPENDYLESLVSFLCHLVNSLCTPALIRCRIDALGAFDERTVPSAVRHHVTLAVKEAVHNALKHSGATELQTRIRFSAPFLTIVISDNGKGFEEEEIKQGNGISNMRHRMAMVKGKVAIESLKGKGTTICFEIPIF